MSQLGLEEGSEIKEKIGIFGIEKVWGSDGNRL